MDDLLSLSCSVILHGESCRPAVRGDASVFPTGDGSGIELALADARFRIDLSIAADPSGGTLHTLRATVIAGPARAVSLGLDFAFAGWSERVYVLAPGAVYAGNRFPVVPDAYPPMPPCLAPDDPDPRPRITRVPRLSAEPGPSRLSIPSNDPSVPGLGFWFPESRTGLWLLTPPVGPLGLFGYDLEENESRSAATLRVTAPCVREHAYQMCDDLAPSPDRPADLPVGSVVEIPVLVHAFPCDEAQGLFDVLPALRRALVPPPAFRPELPLSEAWAILEEKFNRENWVEPAGYYAVGVEPARTQSVHQDWQPGWVGGMLHARALLLRGDALSRERALRNFDFLFAKGQAPSGFFYGVIHQGRVLGDHFRDLAAPWHLVRKSADVLFHGLSAFRLLQARGESSAIRPEWMAGFARCADAFVRLWDRHGQFGQFVNHDTGGLLVAGTASAAIAPAALLLAADLLPDRAADYLRVARASAARFDARHLRPGHVNGGPGEIAQGADSESAAGLLESALALAERAPRDAAAADFARRAALHLASWVFGYDFPFPPDCEFGRLGMLSAGTVLANVQNKHSAPGLCTSSGLALLRLHRLTGDPAPLDLLREIARALPQYLSRADRPIRWSIPYKRPTDPAEIALRPGWMCERVNVTRWGRSEAVGEVFYGSCWPELSLALTAAELPGVYARPDLGRVWCLDHVEAEWSTPACSVLRIHNPTRFPATVRVLVETAAEAACPLAPDVADRWTAIQMKAGAITHHAMDARLSLSAKQGR